MGIFAAESYISLLVAFAILATAIFAFVNSLLYSPQAYEAAGKLTKTTWCTILGLGVVLQFVPLGLFIINIALLVAALVYLADVRPALGSLRRR
ncbi:DUF2516 family protein [Nocardioides sp.]|uniref:DUF2516 family protein n=1 Tax=Nocardioides sp. TaxID=35761 RepID=UPI002B276A3E|nr:DUF2516 family protein [Nocardioides sp.]